METGFIVLDSEGVYRPTGKLVEFLNTDIHDIRYYNYVELMKNNTKYTLYKEPLITSDPPMKLQIMHGAANYGNPIPVHVTYEYEPDAEQGSSVGSSVGSMGGSRRRNKKSKNSKNKSKKSRKTKTKYRKTKSRRH
jgi:hypothetical protein